MDPFTAFAAAGNVLQFTQLGINLISKTIEYSNGGGSSEPQALQDVVQRLMASSAHLHQSLQHDVDGAYEHAPDGSVRCNKPPGTALALHLANEECLRVSKELFELLDRLKLNRYGSVWRSGKAFLLLNDFASPHAAMVTPATER